MLNAAIKKLRAIHVSTTYIEKKKRISLGFNETLKFPYNETVISGRRINDQPLRSTSL